MGNPEITLNTKQVDPTLSDLLRLQKIDILFSLNCHALATVQSFDSVTQSVTATINYKKTRFEEGTDGVLKPVLKDYPLLLDVPVVVLRGGPARIDFPIQSGDACLILFNDRDMDNWLQSGQIGPNASSRAHSFADGVALVGLSPFSDPLENYDTMRAGLSWNETMVKVSADKVKIANTLYTLNGLLQDLINQIKAITVTCAGSGSPSSPPINIAAISAVATQIGSLLE